MAKATKKKVSRYSTRKVDPAFYWMTVPAAILVATRSPTRRDTAPGISSF